MPRAASPAGNGFRNTAGRPLSRPGRPEGGVALHANMHMLRDEFIRRLRRTYAGRREALAGIGTRRQALAYRDEVRRKLAKCFGPLPDRTPLNPRVTRVADRGAFTVECLLFASRPGFLVSANFYLPARRSGPVPGVVVACGHALAAKAYGLYQDVCLRLVRNGYAVLIYDPINQGERLFRPKTRAAADLCGGHNLAGKQLILVDEPFCAWRLWDGIRAVDYLASRPEVDRRQLGITGQSGGGTLSSFIWAFEPRLRMLATSCWQTSYLCDLENEMPADSEQYPPGILRAGLDKIDFLMARLGEPALLLGQEYDYFDDRGLRQGHAELRRLHVLAGGDPALCRLALDTQEHSFSRANQETAVAFFNRVLGRGAPRRVRQPPRQEEQELLATPENDVAAAGSRPMADLIAERARRVAAARARPADIRAALRAVLGIRLPVRVPHTRRFFNWIGRRKPTGAMICHFGVEPEPGILAILSRVGPAGRPHRLAVGRAAHVYLPNLSSEEELASRRTMRGYRDFWCLDPRGIGEGLWGDAGQFVSDYGYDYLYCGYYLMYGECVLGQRVHDVLAVVALLRAEGARRIFLHGAGQGALLALMAGVLDPRIDGVFCRGAPNSYLEQACDPALNWPSSNFPRGILKRLDLPDLRQALGRRLKQDAERGARFRARW